MITLRHMVHLPRLGKYGDLSKLFKKLKVTYSNGNSMFTLYPHWRICTAWRLCCRAAAAHWLLPALSAYMEFAY